jgi:hypothetical protein
MIPKRINNVRSRLMLLFHWRNIGRVSLRPLLTVDPDRPNLPLRASPISARLVGTRKQSLNPPAEGRIFLGEHYIFQRYQLWRP